MKYHIFIFILSGIFITTNSKAQLITISETHQMPSVGDSVHYVNANPFGFDSTGVGNVTSKVWDESSLLNAGTTYDFNFIHPDSVLPGFYKDSFPSATIARGESGSSGYFYYENSSNDINRLGWALNSSNFGIYKDNTVSTEFHFPITAGQTYTSSYHGIFAPLNLGEDSVTIESGVTTGNADMQGQLILPTGTFDSILRVHVTEIFHLKAYLFGSAITDEVIFDDYYYWFSDTIFQPLLIFGKTYQNGSVQATVLRYQPLVPTTNSISENKTERIQVYPNPTNGKFILDNRFQYLKNANIQIYNCFGEKILFEIRHDQNSDEIDISSAARGIYLVNTTSNNSPATFKIVKY